MHGSFAFRAGSLSAFDGEGDDHERTDTPTNPPRACPPESASLLTLAVKQRRQYSVEFLKCRCTDNLCLVLVAWQNRCSFHRRISTPPRLYTKQDTSSIEVNLYYDTDN